MDDLETAVRATRLARQQPAPKELDFRIGDVVSIHIPDENWSAGYQPCPQGSIAVVTGYAHVMYGDGPEDSRPVRNEFGPAVNPYWVRVVLENGGKEYLEFCSRLRLEGRKSE